MPAEAEKRPEGLGDKIKRWTSGVVTSPVELLTAGVLAMAGLLIAWSGLQSGLWDGEQASHYTAATAVRTDAARSSDHAAQFAAVDVQLFTVWLEAHARGDEKVKTFFETRFRPEFKPAFEDWVSAPEAARPATPFASPLYKSAAQEKAKALDRKAEKLFAEGQEANRISDAFLEASVVLAMAMFLAGIAQIFHSPKVVLALALIGAVLTIVSAIRMLGLPALEYIWF